MAACLGAAVALAVAGPAVAHRGARKRAVRPVSLEWVGDIAMSTSHGLPPGGVAGALAPVTRDLRGADITAGNLEGTLSVGGRSKCASLPPSVCYAFQAPPGYAFGLRRVGFDLVNQANNHSMDFGPSGRAQTVGALHRAGVAVTGFPGQITYLRRHGVRVAFVGFAPYPYDASLLDVGAAQALVRRAHRHAALVVAIIHAGAEGADRDRVPYGTEYYLGENRGDPRRFAHAMIDAGASVVFGSGPHVIRGVERYRGRLIAYSLGDFLGYRTLDDHGVLSLSGILRVSLLPGGRVVSARWIAVRLEGGLPRPDPSGASVRLVRALSQADFPRDRWTISPSGTFRI